MSSLKKSMLSAFQKLKKKGEESAKKQQQDGRKKKEGGGKSEKKKAGVSKHKGGKGKNQKKKGEKKRGGIEKSTKVAEKKEQKNEQKRDTKKGMQQKGGKDGKKKMSTGEAKKEELRERLAGGKFRWLNELYYTSTGEDAEKFFKENPSAYSDYLKGFSKQAVGWPVVPVDKMISHLQKMGKDKVIADMGCGDAKIARTLKHRTVHSFDLVPSCDKVTRANIAHVPLKDKAADCVVFCLSLMGINFAEYVLEANRILKMGGTLLIAEVESRFEEHPVGEFVRGLEKLGFKTKTTENMKYFVFIEAKKVAEKDRNMKIEHIDLEGEEKWDEGDQEEAEIEGEMEEEEDEDDVIEGGAGPRSILQLKPCLYKKR